MKISTLKVFTAAEAKGWHVIAVAPVQGDGVQAQGSVVLCYIADNIMRQYAVHFFNVQDGGFHSGHYHTTRGEAFAKFAMQAERYTRHHKEVGRVGEGAYG